jgi:DNA adenine methylase
MPRSAFPYGATVFYISHRVTRYFPKHRIYVEPFVGAASVFLSKPLAEINVLGDANPIVIKTLQAIRTGELQKRLIENKKFLLSIDKDKFNELKKCAGYDPFCFYVARWLSFGSKGTNLSPTSKQARDLDTPGRFEARMRHMIENGEKLKRARLVIGDFEKTMRAYDSKDTFHFLDPPWVYEGGRCARAAEESLKGFNDCFDVLDRIASLIPDLKGKVMVVNKTSSAFIDKLSGIGMNFYKMKTVSFYSPVDRSNQREKVYWLIATNYDVKTGG